ncbi:unnamed protein product [Sphenostylis stenocarpa]|uniref:Uncharacterized protein n=1 Tax=Sphenostylis stenocarpa TaxID=92480 RepID=A0AA86VC14_9FABA|nr:unnamed protein product [Sphenostylis stenocarpa]
MQDLSMYEQYYPRFPFVEDSAPVFGSVDLLLYYHGRISQDKEVARGQIEKAGSIKKRLNQAADATDPTQPTFAQSVPFAPFQTTEDDNKKAVAAAVAAKLAASASSAQMLTSVLSSLVAEEAASLGSTGLPISNPEKRPKLEKPTPVLDVNSSDMTNSSFYAATIQQPSLASVPLLPSGGIQTASQANQLQATFSSAPPPPPHSSANQPSNQYVHSTGLMAGAIPYGYGPNSLPPPPPPPLPPHVAIGLSMPGNQPAQQQQQSPPGGFYRPPGIGFYGQSHPSTPPPVPRQ